MRPNHRVSPTTVRTFNSPLNLMVPRFWICRIAQNFERFRTTDTDIDFFHYAAASFSVAMLRSTILPILQSSIRDLKLPWTIRGLLTKVIILAMLADFRPASWRAAM